MAPKTGTLDIASLFAARNVTAVAFGLNTIERVLNADNDNYNFLVQQALRDLAETTTDRLRFAGSSIGGDMQEADEYSRIPTQKDFPGYPIGFPERKYQFAVGWTKQWEKKRSPADFATAQKAAQGADLRRIRYEIQKAIYGPTNYTFFDYNVDNAQLPVKAFVNADAAAIQNGPNGEIFNGSTHTHYDGSATLTAAALQAEINDVVEHGYGRSVKVFINQVDAAAVQALPGFQAYPDPRVSLNANANQPNQERLDITRMDNRALGIFGQAEVWTKPWAVANYAFITDTDPESPRPLIYRQDPDSQGLHIEAELDTFPLRAQYQEHVFGFGVWNRLNGAVLQFNNAVYSAPALSY
jgi:hypothetical protein